MCSSQYFQQRMDHPGMAANPIPSQFNRVKSFFSLSPFAPENLVSRETGSAVSSGVSPLILYTQTESGAYPRGSSRLLRRHPRIRSTTIGSVPIGSCDAIAHYCTDDSAYCRESVGARLEGSCSNGRRCLFTYFVLFCLYFVTILWAMGLNVLEVTNPINCNIVILPVIPKDLLISPRFSPYVFLSRCKFSPLTTRRTIINTSFWILLTFPRFPLRKPE